MLGQRDGYVIGGTKCDMKMFKKKNICDRLPMHVGFLGVQ